MLLPSSPPSPSPRLSFAVLLALLGVGLAAAPAAAQVTLPFYDFQLTGPAGLVEVPLGATVVVEVTFTDNSHDGTGAVPGAPNSGALPHQVELRAIPAGRDPTGWFVTQPTGFTTFGGQTQTAQFTVRVQADAVSPDFKVVVNATIRAQTDQSVHYRETSVAFFTTGLPGFVFKPGSALLGLAPREIRTGSLSVVNNGEYPLSVAFELVRNDCGLAASAPADIVVPAAPDNTRDVAITVKGPETRFDPLGAPYCSLAFHATATRIGPGSTSTGMDQTLTVQLAPAIAFDPVLLFWLAVLLLLLVLLVLFLRRRKEKVEEELLGKPQKPWTIPVEQVYLRELKARDPRAWYVVRHYLMEDEYKSALLWYKAYKKGTKGARAKERVILGHEKAYAKWKAAWAKRIAKPVQKADRYEAKLQRKLDRKARRAHRKATRKHKKAVARLEARHAKKAAALKEAHAKAVAKAQRKNRPLPDAPDLSPPALPPTPQLQARPLAGHRWAKKAARHRRRRVRQQGNLEVRFERQDARYLAKLSRKVRRIARKLDDPDFVAEHPLLGREPTEN